MLITFRVRVITFTHRQSAANLVAVAEEEYLLRLLGDHHRRVTVGFSSVRVGGGGHSCGRGRSRRGGHLSSRTRKVAVYTRASKARQLFG